MALVEVKVPDIGDFADVAVIELLVAPGDTIKVEQSLITVESDKSSMEIPSSAAGVVKELKVKLGDKVKEGSVVLLLEVADGGAKAPAAQTQQAPAAPENVAKVAPAATPVAAPAASGPVEVRVPDIGDFKDVAVIEVFVQPGDSIKVEQSLITVESDKASMEIPSSAAGVLKELKVKVGDKINQGDLLAVLLVVPGTELTLTALATRTGGSLAAVQREATRLEDAGILRSRRIGNARLVLGMAPGGPKVPAAGVPARRTDLAGLPPAFIAVGGIDLFVSEDINYARRLTEAGVPTELLVLPGAFHGFDRVAPNTRIAKTFTKAKLDALRKAFGEVPAL